MNVHVPPPTQLDTLYRRAIGIAKREDDIARIVQLWRRRQGWIRASTKLTLQGHAIARGICNGDKGAGADLYKMVSGIIANMQKAESRSKTPIAIDLLGNEHLLLESIEPLEHAKLAISAARDPIDKELSRLAKAMPGASLCANTKGVGLGGTSFASVIGNAGDLAAYPNPACLWKRMGLAVIGDQRQRRIKGSSKELAELAIEHGYNPERRSAMYVIGTCLVKKRGEMRTLYDAQKAEYLVRCTARKSEMRDTIDPTTGNVKKYSPTGHANNMAMRYISKRFLRDLWVSWNAESDSVDPDFDVPNADEIFDKAKIVHSVGETMKGCAMTTGAAAVILECQKADLAAALRGKFGSIDIAQLEDWRGRIERHAAT